MNETDSKELGDVLTDIAKDVAQHLNMSTILIIITPDSEVAAGLAIKGTDIELAADGVHEIALEIAKEAIARQN